MDPKELCKDFVRMPEGDYLTLSLTVPVSFPKAESKIRKVLEGVAPGFEPDFLWRSSKKFRLFKVSVD